LPQTLQFAILTPPKISPWWAEFYINFLYSQTDTEYYITFIPKKQGVLEKYFQKTAPDPYLFICHNKISWEFYFFVKKRLTE